jgi:hypothetical protein
MYQLIGLVDGLSGDLIQGVFEPLPASDTVDSPRGRQGVHLDCVNGGIVLAG